VLYSPKARHSLQNLARRLASPLFLPAASSYHDVLTVALLDNAGAAYAEAEATGPDELELELIQTQMAQKRMLRAEVCALMKRSVTGPLVSSFCPPTSATYHFLCRDCAQTCGWSGGKGRDASSTLGSDEAGDDNVDRATRAAIARACEVDRGYSGG
jgi:hypothetical protein